MRPEALSVRSAEADGHGASTAPPWAQALLQAPEPNAAQYMAAAPAEHRQRFGQHFTPPLIGAWMADWVLQPNIRSVLDPAVGTGALLEAVLAQPYAQRAAIEGYDADPIILEVCRQHLGGGSPLLKLHAADFLLAPIAARFDAVVCNPPYLRHRALAHRTELYSSFEQACDLKLNRFSNSYVLFLLKIAGLLSAGGRAAVITPVDFLNANFGTPIKAFLLRENVLDGLVVFDCSTLVFAEANVAACIVLLRADRSANAPIRFVEVPSEAELAPLPQLPPAWQTQLQPADLAPSAKWLSARRAPPVVGRSRRVPLGRLATVRRGIATGANEFFTLTAGERAQHGLETEAHLCITKAAHAPYLTFSDEDVGRLVHADKKLYLLDVRDAPSPAAAAYLSAGERRSLHLRYLTKQRQPWYAAEQRSPAPLWATTFTRRCFRFVLNEVGAANLTAFHAIYPFEHDPEYVLLLAAFLNGASAAPTLAQHCRSYGSGLRKLEPLDVAALHVPDPAAMSSSLRAEINALYAARCQAERAQSADAAMLAQALDQLWQQL